MDTLIREKLMEKSVVFFWLLSPEAALGVFLLRTATMMCDLFM